MFIGFSILAIGIILLLNNLGIISGDVWGMIWPALLIVLGLSLILKPYRISRRFRHYVDSRKNN